MKKLVAFLLLFSLMASGGCGGGGGGDNREKTYQISGRVYDFEKYAKSARVELWTLDRKTMLASTDVFESAYDEDMTYFSFPEDEKFAGRLLLSADVEGLGKMLGIADATQPTVEAITPLSTLVLEVAGEDYSETAVGKAERTVAAFIGVASDDDYCSKSLIGIIPPIEGGENEISAFDPTEFSYEAFKRELLPAGGGNFNTAIADWAERAKRRETLESPLVSTNPAFPLPGPGPVPPLPKKPGFISWSLKAVGKGALAYAGGEILGLVLKLVMEGGEHKETMDTLKSMSKKLDEIQRTLSRLDVELKSILADLKVDVAYGRMSTRVDDIRTAYNKHLLDIATDKSVDKNYRKELVKKFVNYYEMKLDADLLALHSNLTGDNFDGKAFYKLMVDNALAAIRAGSMTMETAVERYAFAYTFFVGVQLKGMICKVEILNQTATNPTDRKTKVLKEIDNYKERVTKQAAIFIENAEVLVTAAAQNSGATFNYLPNMPDNEFMSNKQPIAHNPYYIIDQITADSRGVEMQIVFRLLFSPMVLDKPWTRDEWRDRSKEGWWAGVWLRDYSTYFYKTGVKEMMQKLVNNTEGKHFPVYLKGRTDIKASNGEFGTVHKLRWNDTKNNASPKEKEAYILRYVFSGAEINSRDTYQIAVDERAKNFVIDTNPKNVYRGTIGSHIINQTGYSDAAMKKALSVSLKSEEPYCSIATFAWLPDNFILYGKESNRDMGYPAEYGGSDNALAIQSLPAMSQNRHAYVCKGTEIDRLVTYYAACDGQASPKHIAPEGTTARKIFFRQYESSLGELQYAYYENYGGRMLGFRLDSDGLRMVYDYYTRNKHRPIFFVQPPSIISMFLDASSYLPTAREPIFVLYHYPLFIGTGRYGYWHWNDNGKHITSASDGGTNHDAYWVLSPAN